MPSTKVDRRSGLSITDVVNCIGGSADTVKLPTLIGSRTNSASSLAFIKGSTKDSLGRNTIGSRKGLAFGQKGSVWDALPSEKSVCKGEDVLRHIHHLKVNSEAEKGHSLIEVCRISMRTRDLLVDRLQWLDSAMAELRLQADTSAGRVTEEEFVRVLRPFTESVLDDDERIALFKMLDGEKKGYVTVQLTENEHRKCEELKRMRKVAHKVTNINGAISRMWHHQPNDAANGSPHAQPQQPLPSDPIMEDAANGSPHAQPEQPLPSDPIMEDEHSPQGHKAQPLPSDPIMEEPPSAPVLRFPQMQDDHSPQGHPVSAGITNPEQDFQTMTKETTNNATDLPSTSTKKPSQAMEFSISTPTNAAGDEELQELERRLDELRAEQAARLHRRRKRELEAQIEALQRELEAKTPTAKTPYASESPRGVKSKVSFALPATLQPCEG